MLRTAPIFILLIGLLLLPGCGELVAKQATDHRVHVQIWSMWGGPEEQDFNEVLAYYNKTHPGVEIDNLGTVDDDKVIRAIVAGVPPDLCTISTSANLGALAANDALMPLDDRFAASGLKPNDYTPGALGQCEYLGHLYAVPYLLDCTALLYNKDVFRAAGLDPNKPPVTLEEMAHDAQVITRHDASGRLSRIGIQPIPAVNLLGAFGSHYVDQHTGAITASDTHNVEALNYLKDLMDKEGGFENVDAFSLGFSSATSNYNPFFTGETGMIVDGEWNTYWAFHYSPKTHYGIAPLPYPANHPELKGTVLIGANPICIPRGAKHVQAAWDFLVWTQTPQAQELFASKINNIPNIRSVLHDPKLRTGAIWRPKFAQFLDLADSPSPSYFPPMPVATLYTNQLQFAADSVCYGRASAAPALSAVQARTQRDLNRYKQ